MESGHNMRCIFNDSNPNCNFVSTDICFEKIHECFFSVPIQLSHGDNSAVLLITIVQIAYAFGILMICCEMGQQINLAYDECSEMIDQFDWYLCTYNIQRLLPTIINFAQQPVDIKCFGSTTLDRDTFKYVSLIENSLHFSINSLTKTIFHRLSIRHTHTLRFYVNCTNKI